MDGRKKIGQRGLDLVGGGSSWGALPGEVTWAGIRGAVGRRGECCKRREQHLPTP